MRFSAPHYVTLRFQKSPLSNILRGYFSFEKREIFKESFLGNKKKKKREPQTRKQNHCPTHIHHFSPLFLETEDNNNKNIPILQLLFAPRLFSPQTTPPHTKRSIYLPNRPKDNSITTKFPLENP